MANTRASDDHQSSQLARYNKGLLLRICDGNMENTMEWVAEGEPSAKLALFITF